MNSSVIHSRNDIMGGTPVFKGTRVPFQNLIDYLKAGHSLAEKVIELAGSALLSTVHETAA